MRLCEILESESGGADTSWSYEDGSGTVTLQDVIRDLDQRNVRVIDLPLQQIRPLIIKQDYTGQAKQRTSSADLNYPIIVIKNNGKYEFILDGNHRAFKAVSSGASSIKARVIDLNDAKTPEAYRNLFG